jgi:hypothetical protein
MKVCGLHLDLVKGTKLRELNNINKLSSKETGNRCKNRKDDGSPGMRLVVREPISQNPYRIGFSALPPKSQLYNKLQFLA